ncbi:hypothetical protein AKJ40_03570 [candidate division MSBL1 archaeon SCGC-AAA259M10]|uniref:MoaD/ThiS family protein n=1 Tax=candidate division MSBL1 archaeon SCGC-AAA259M10 TaxID=1698270 RepID=A0A133UYK4_9EURY|nr:hypothetical protein AKJ40_03570 [candidate division MSBL1 archaeon SCGC-AAA259M10]
MTTVSIKILGLTAENRNKIKREVSLEKPDLTISDVLREVQEDIENTENVIDLDKGENNLEVTILKNGNPTPDLGEKLEDGDSIVVLTPMPGG